MGERSILNGISGRQHRPIQCAMRSHASMHPSTTLRVGVRHASTFIYLTMCVATSPGGRPRAPTSMDGSDDNTRRG